jgi:hypothetical protein
MSTIEITGSRIRIWCLVRGDNKTFYVNIGTNNFIIDLKELIKEKKKSVFSNVDADDITLWSVSIDQSELNSEGFSIEGRFTNNNKLRASADTVGATFTNVEGTDIRVIIGVPVDTGKL